MKDAQPTLVLSGVNRGSNLADDVTYSGTIAGAMEGCALGIRRLRFAILRLRAEERYPLDCARPTARRCIRKLVETAGRGCADNVNFPDCEPDDVKGTEITMQGKRDMQTAALDRRIDARGFPYFWIGFKRVRSNPPKGRDLRAIYEKRISVTPLHLNLTERDVVQKPA